MFSKPNSNQNPTLHEHQHDFFFGGKKVEPSDTFLIFQKLIQNQLPTNSEILSVCNELIPTIRRKLFRDNVTSNERSFGFSLLTLLEHLRDLLQEKNNDNIINTLIHQLIHLKQLLSHCFPELPECEQETRKDEKEEDETDTSPLSLLIKFVAHLASNRNKVAALEELRLRLVHMTEIIPSSDPINSTLRTEIEAVGRIIIILMDGIWRPNSQHLRASINTREFRNSLKRGLDSIAQTLECFFQRFIFPSNGESKCPVSFDPNFFINASNLFFKLWNKFYLSSFNELPKIIEHLIQELMEDKALFNLLERFLVEAKNFLDVAGQDLYFGRASGDFFKVWQNIQLRYQTDTLSFLKCLVFPIIRKVLFPSFASALSQIPISPFQYHGSKHYIQLSNIALHFSDLAPGSLDIQFHNYGVLGLFQSSHDNTQLHTQFSLSFDDLQLQLKDLNYRYLRKFKPQLFDYGVVDVEVKVASVNFLWSIRLVSGSLVFKAEDISCRIDEVNTCLKDAHIKTLDKLRLLYLKSSIKQRIEKIVEGSLSEVAQEFSISRQVFELVHYLIDLFYPLKESEAPFSLPL